MFNIKYNFLVLIQVILNMLNALLLLKVFGVSIQVDAYLITTSIIATIQLVQLMFFEQFIVFYTGLKVKSTDESSNFYSASLFLSFIIGILSIVILYSLGNIIFKIFAFNIDLQRLNFLNHISTILFLSLIFTPIYAVNDKLLNAEMRFSIPYLLSSLPNLFIVIAQLIVYFSHQNKIIYLAYGQVLGLALSVLVGTIFIVRKIIPFKIIFYHPEIKQLFKNSFATRLGDNIYNTLLPILLNNLLVTMSAGYVSYFYYAKKIIDTLKLLTIGPAAKILTTNLTNFWISNNIEKIREHTRKFLKGSLIIMICGIILSYFAIPTVLKIISMGKLSNNDIININYIFLSLCPWYLVVLLEAPYILMIFTSKKSTIAIITNTLFILTFFIISYLLKNYIGIYCISVGALVAQLLNYVIYKNYAKKLLLKFHPIKESEINTRNIIYNID